MILNDGTLTDILACEAIAVFSGGDREGAGSCCLPLLTSNNAQYHKNNVRIRLYDANNDRQAKIYNIGRNWP